MKKKFILCKKSETNLQLYFKRNHAISTVGEIQKNVKYLEKIIKNDGECDIWRQL